METTLIKESAPGPAKENRERTEYKDGVWSFLEKEVAEILKEEMKRAVQELVDEQKRMIKQLLEENKMVIRQILDEEKKSARAKADELRKSILTVIP